MAVTITCPSTIKNILANKPTAAFLDLSCTYLHRENITYGVMAVVMICGRFPSQKDTLIMAGMKNQRAPAGTPTRLLSVMFPHMTNGRPPAKNTIPRRSI